MGRWSGRVALAAAAAVGAAAGWEGYRRWALPRTSIERIRLLLDFDRATEAGELLRARLDRDPRDNEGWLLEGRRRAVGNDLAGAADAFGRIDSASLYYPEGQLRRGQAALLRHDALVAEEGFRATLSRGKPGGPAWTEAAMQLLTLWNLQDRGAEAGALVEELLRHAGPEQRAALQDELTIRATGRVDVRERVGALQAYVAANPADLESLGAWALALCEDGRPDEGLDLVRPAFEARADPPYILWRAMLRTLFENQRFEELRAAAPRAPAMARDQTWYWSFLATAQLRGGEPAAALASMQKALALDDQELAVNRLAANVFHQAGRADLAQAAEARAELRTKREKELRDAWRNWTECNAGRKPYTTTAAAGTRLAAACAALGQEGRAAYYREMAGAFAELARRGAVTP